ncbi:MAG: inner rane transporter RhtA [Actinomycetota bacterium]|nr:inner rane transporter RhtA [Actinomycetota bacterium]
MDNQPASSAARLGSSGLVVLGLVCQELGAAIAITLFPAVGATGTVLLRLAFSAGILLLVFRPSFRGRSRGDWLTVIGFGLVLAIMNAFFYESLLSVPLGAAVTIELMGPLILSVVISHRPSAWLWAALAIAGVVLLGWTGVEGRLNLVGALFAAAAGGMWVCYILLSARTGRHFSRLDGLAIAMAIGAVAIAPIGILTAGTALLKPVDLALGLAVAVLSSAVPYGLELISLRRLPAATFSILLSLAPAIAAVAGFLVLRQQLTPLGSVGIGCVVIASSGAVVAAARRASPPTGVPAP